MIKKTKLMFFFILLFSSIVLFWCSKKQNEIINNKESIWVIKIQEHIWDESLVIDFQQKLANLIVNYSNAQLATNIFFAVDPEKMPLEDYIDFGKNLVLQREFVEENANEIWNILITKNHNFWWKIKNRIIPIAIAQNFEINNNSKSFNDAPLNMFSPDDFQISNDLMSNFVLQPNTDYTDGWAKSVTIDQDKRSQVEAIRWKMPELWILNTVQAVFWTTAQDAKALIDEHYKSAAEYYNDKAKFFENAAKQSEKAKTLSKVTLYVGWGVLTAWWSTILTTPTLWGALVAWMWSSIWLTKWTLITLWWVSAILDVWANSATIWLATTWTAATFKELKDAYKPISTTLSLIDLKDWLNNPWNLMTIYELWSDWLEYLTMRLDNDNLMISHQNPWQNYINEDGILKYIPQNMINNLVSPEEIKQITKNQEKLINEKKEQKEKALGNVGVYKWTTKLESNIQWQKVTFNLETQMLIWNDWYVNIKFDWQDKVHQNVQWISMSFDYIFNWEAIWSILLDWKDLNANWDFTSHAKMNLPKWMHIPPEYLAQMQAWWHWTISVAWKISNWVFVWTANFVWNWQAYDSNMELTIQ